MATSPLPDVLWRVVGAGLEPSELARARTVSRALSAALGHDALWQRHHARDWGELDEAAWSASLPAAAPGRAGPSPPLSSSSWAARYAAEAMRQGRWHKGEYRLDASLNFDRQWRERVTAMAIRGDTLLAATLQGALLVLELPSCALVWRWSLTDRLQDYGTRLWLSGAWLIAYVGQTHQLRVWPASVASLARARAGATLPPPQLELPFASDPHAMTMLVSDELDLLIATSAESNSSVGLWRLSDGRRLSHPVLLSGFVAPYARCNARYLVFGGVAGAFDLQTGCRVELEQVESLHRADPTRRWTCSPLERVLSLAGQSASKLLTAPVPVPVASRPFAALHGIHVWPSAPALEALHTFVWRTFADVARSENETLYAISATPRYLALLCGDETLYLLDHGPLA